jgi:hypothetical protein
MLTYSADSFNQTSAATMQRSVIESNETFNLRSVPTSGVCLVCVGLQTVILRPMGYESQGYMARRQAPEDGLYDTASHPRRRAMTRRHTAEDGLYDTASHPRRPI